MFLAWVLFTCKRICLCGAFGPVGDGVDACLPWAQSLILEIICILPKGLRCVL